LFFLVTIWFGESVDIEVPRSARVSLPVEIVLRIASALQIKLSLLSSWAMSEWNMIIGDVVEEVNLLFLQEKSGGDRVYWSITPTFIKESTILVERLEEIYVRLAAEPVEIADFEV